MGKSEEERKKGRERKAKKKREAIESGLCGKCLCVSVVNEPYQTCLGCRLRSRKLQKKHYDKKASNKSCVQCGSPDTLINNIRYCAFCAEMRQKSQRDQRKNLKRRVINKYGGFCSCCKETIIDFLCIDHINNDGGKERGERGPSNFYRRLDKSPIRDDLQVLCHNCNAAKQFYGECPHQEDKRLADQEKEKPLA